MRHWTVLDDNTLFPITGWNTFSVVTFIPSCAQYIDMDKNQIIAILFAGLMVTSMIAWGALYMF